jgi:hypothetical protein
MRNAVKSGLSGAFSPIAVSEKIQIFVGQVRTGERYKQCTKLQKLRLCSVRFIGRKAATLERSVVLGVCTSDFLLR